MDRFQVGATDSQDQALDFISKCGCGGKTCRDNIHVGDACWEYDGDYYATLECLAWSVGANNVFAGQEQLV